MSQLTLYHFEGCPYCQKVRDYFSAQQISIPMKDIHAHPKYRDELIKIGGKGQVPCLVIDAKALYESLNIIQWFQDNWKR